MANAPQKAESLLFAEILEQAEENKKTTCSVARLLEEMSDVDRTGLELALDTPSITGTAITAVLKRRGHQISSHTVQRHRRKGCGCIR